jgi:hypothetical protein
VADSDTESGAREGALPVSPTMPEGTSEGALPRWWGWFRRVSIFVLGVLVILDALYAQAAVSMGELVVGLLMIGVLPLDDLLRAAQRPHLRRKGVE